MLAVCSKFSILFTNQIARAW